METEWRISKEAKVFLKLIFPFSNNKKVILYTYIESICVDFVWFNLDKFKLDRQNCSYYFRNFREKL